MGDNLVEEWTLDLDPDLLSSHHLLQDQSRDQVNAPDPVAALAVNRVEQKMLSTHQIFLLLRFKLFYTNAIPKVVAHLAHHLPVQSLLSLLASHLEMRLKLTSSLVWQTASLFVIPLLRPKLLLSNKLLNQLLTQQILLKPKCKLFYTNATP